MWKALEQAVLRWYLVWRPLSFLALIVIAVAVAVIAPRMARAARDPGVNATGDTIQTVWLEASRFHHATGRWAGEGEPGRSNADLDDMLGGANPLGRPVPIGGVWDWENWSGGGDIRLAIRGGADAGASPTLADLKGVDAMIDDGNLSTGRFMGDPSYAFFQIYP